MLCTKCNDTGIYNEVLGKGFYYCRTCKVEIKLEVAPGEDRVEFDREYDTWLEQQQLDAVDNVVTFPSDYTYFPTY